MGAVTVESIQEFKERQRRIRGPEMVPDSAFENHSQSKAGNLADSISQAFSAPRVLIIHGEKIVIEEPTVRELKLLIAEVDLDAIGEMAGAGISRQINIASDEGFFPLIAAFIDHPRLKTVAEKVEWFSDLKISEAMTVAETVTDVCDIREVINRGVKIMGKVRGVPARAKT